MINIKVSPAIRAVCPEYALAAIACDIINTAHNEKLWEEISLFEAELRAGHQMEDINKRPNIAETRAVYRQLGKDPNRYRPSGEALCRRIIKEMPLYRIDTAVDLINLLSIKTGYSIGAFDAECILGDLELGVGEAGETFNAIGRGLLNIEGLPVYRDSKGGIGTPTSDEERTKITRSTKKLLVIINGYSGEKGLPDAVEFAKKLLSDYVAAANIQTKIVRD